MEKTIDVSTVYKPRPEPKLLNVNTSDETIKVTFSNPSTIVLYHTNTENEIDITREEFDRFVKKIARPL
jgi:hypothetical protein